MSPASFAPEAALPNAPGASMVMNDPLEYEKPCDMPLASVKTPTIWPILLIPAAAVDTAPGTSMVVNVPADRRKACVPTASENDPTMSLASLIPENEPGPSTRKIVNSSPDSRKLEEYPSQGGKSQNVTTDRFPTTSPASLIPAGRVSTIPTIGGAGIVVNVSGSPDAGEPMGASRHHRPVTMILILMG